MNQDDESEFINEELMSVLLDKFKKREKYQLVFEQIMKWKYHHNALIRTLQKKHVEEIVKYEKLDKVIADFHIIYVLTQIKTAITSYDSGIFVIFI